MAAQTPPVDSTRPPTDDTAHDSAMPPHTHHMGSVFLIVAAIIVIVIALFVGIRPRLTQKSSLANGVKEVKATLPEVTLTSPKWVSDPGLSLPGNIQAIKEATLDARTTGYLREMYVDIGSHVNAGQVLAVIQSPDVDQQAFQAEAQTAQSRATVGQSKAAVAQSQATVAQDQAEVARQRAAVQQARQAVTASQAQAAQTQAQEKGTEAALAHANQALQVQRAAMKQAQAQLELASVTNKRYQDLLAQGFVAQQDADTAAATLRVDQAQVQSSQAAIDAAQADVATAVQTVASAKAAVTAAQANVQSSVENVRAANASLDSTKATVSAAQHAVQASSETVRANQSAVASNVANARRFDVMRGFEKITAPFTGVITARNVDVGALINAGGSSTSPTASATSTAGMLGIARTDVVRIQVYVPQTYVPALAKGSKASVTVRELPKRVFTGDVSLRAGALDMTSRTQLIEVHVDNKDRALVPGMYAETKIVPLHPNRTIHIQGTALVVDANGTRVVVVGPDDTVHLRKVTVGRDFGTEVEILKGLKGREKLVNNPPDTLQDNTKVQVLVPPPSKDKPGARGSKKTDDT